MRVVATSHPRRNRHNVSTEVPTARTTRSRVTNPAPGPAHLLCASTNVDERATARRAAPECLSVPVSD